MFLPYAFRVPSYTLTDTHTHTNTHTPTHTHTHTHAHKHTHAHTRWRWWGAHLICKFMLHSNVCIYLYIIGFETNTYTCVHTHKTHTQHTHNTRTTHTHTAHKTHTTHTNTHTTHTHTHTSLTHSHTHTHTGVQGTGSGKCAINTAWADSRSLPRASSQCRRQEQIEAHKKKSHKCSLYSVCMVSVLGR